MTWSETLARLAPPTVAEAARHWGQEPGSVALVNPGVNHVYRADDLYLRLTHAALRNEASLGPPLAFLRHAFAGGAAVNEPLPSSAGRWVEAIAQGEDRFLATAVRGVAGERLSDLAPSPGLYRAFGRSIGELHAATRDYQPKPGEEHIIEPDLPGVFPTWRWLWGRARRWAYRAPAIARAFDELTPWVEAVGGLPESWPESGADPGVGYGLTHGDMRPGNTIWNGTQVVVIDFDEPVHGPLANDLARAALELDAPARRALVPHLLAGYREVMPLADGWVEAMPRLMAARAALMSAWSLEDHPDVPPASESGSGAVVSVKRLAERLESGDFLV